MSFLQSHYQGALKKIQETLLAVGSRHVNDIKAERNDCLESYPCCGHGKAIIDLDDGTTMRVSCTSVEMGALMWYFKCGSDHFTEYIDESFASYLRENIGGR
jgi:hypothetical protein